jgi:Curli production assembly/transport component CsgG
MKHNTGLLLMISVLPILAVENIAVLDFYSPNIDQAEVKMLSDILRTELVNSGGFSLMERNQMNEVLKEQGFQASGCMNDSCAVEIGQLIGAKSIIAGSIGFVETSCIISLRIINIRTGKIDKMTEYHFAGTLSDAVSFGIKNAVLQLTDKAKQQNAYEQYSGLLSRLKSDKIYQGIYETLEQLLVKRIAWLNNRASIDVTGWQISKISETTYLVSYEFILDKGKKAFHYQIVTDPWLVTDLFGNDILLKKYGLNKHQVESVLGDPLGEFLDDAAGKQTKHEK